MRYVSEEQKNLRNIYDKYLEKDSKGFFYLPDTAPKEAKEAYGKVKKMIRERHLKNDLDGFIFEE